MNIYKSIKYYISYVKNTRYQIYMKIMIIHFLQDRDHKIYLIYVKNKVYLIYNLKIIN